MFIDDRLLDELQREAKASPRLRMHRDMRTTSADTSQRMLNAVESSVVFSAKDGAYAPQEAGDVLSR